MRSRRAAQTQASWRRSSFTLIEVLVSLSLAALLVSVTGRIALQAATTRTAAVRILAVLERGAVVCDRIAEDVSSILPRLPDDQSPVLLFGTPRQVLQLSVLSPMPSGADSLHLARRPTTVRYRLVGERTGGTGLDLIRETIDLTDRGAEPVRETIALGVSEFSVEILRKNEWTRRYPDEKDRDAAARAVRITCRWVDVEKPVTRTMRLRDAP